MNRGQIFEKMQEILVEALLVEEDEIKEESALIRDLGAESIDFLDIIFRMEHMFKIKIPRGEFFLDEDFQEVLDNPDFCDEGRFTKEGVALINKRLPLLKTGILESNPTIRNLTDCFTVGYLVDFVAAKLAA